MLDQETKRKIDNARDILVGKVPDPKSQVEQITIALIYKFMDDMDKESVEMGAGGVGRHPASQGSKWYTARREVFGSSEQKKMLDRPLLNGTVFSLAQPDQPRIKQLCAHFAVAVGDVQQISRPRVLLAVCLFDGNQRNVEQVWLGCVRVDKYGTL